MASRPCWPLIAHGTNLGLATLAHSVEAGITTEMLQEMSQWCLREDTLKAANAILVNFHHRLPLSAVWGDGLVSSSDGQRFGLQASSLLGSLYPRYFGYYERAGAEPDQPGERRHQLARRLFFANQGAFQTGDYDEIMNRRRASVCCPMPWWCGIRCR